MAEQRDKIQQLRNCVVKLDIVAGSGNDEFYTPKYAIEPILKYLDSKKTIWCPFDTEDSLFVKTFKQNGFK